MARITASDPAALNAAAQLAMQAAQIAPERAPVDESSLELLDTVVTLPGGYITQFADVVTEVEVRELNGYDEEAFARAGSVGKSLLAILDRATVRVGDEPATRSLLDGLLSGDRDFILLNICRVTYGDDATYTAQCPHCQTVGDVELSLSKDVPVRRLVDPADRFFEVKHRNMTVSVQLPTGETQRALFNKGDATFPEINSALLAGCVVEINGMPVIGISSVKNLGVALRTKITAEIAKRNPGPLLTEVKKPCGSCGGEMPLALTMSELFRLA